MASILDDNFPRAKHSFDPGCLALAEAFLADADHAELRPKINDLAQEIQTAIEDWIAHEEAGIALKAEPEESEGTEAEPGAIETCDNKRCHIKAGADGLFYVYVGQEGKLGWISWHGSREEAAAKVAALVAEGYVED